MECNNTIKFEKMKVQNSIIVLIIMALFASCTNTAQKPKEFVSGAVVTEKKISQIIVQGEDGKHKYKYHYTLEYDEKGRVLKIEPDHSDIFGTFYCEYDDDMFRMGKGDMYVTGSLNEEGFVESAGEYDFLEELLVGKMKYNNKGQLVSLSNSDMEKVSFTWSDDNMVRLNVMDEQINFVYTSLENKNKFGFLLLIDKENCTPVYPYYMLLGTPSKNLPQSIGQGDSAINYRYKQDEDGYINEMTLIYPDSRLTSYTFVYDL